MPQIRVLIVDDDRRTQAALRALLSTYPACLIVGEADNGAQAIAQVERAQPDCVVLDVQMPVLDGIQATWIIKQRWPQVAVVVLTMDSGHRSAALAAGADGFMSKVEPPERVVTLLQAAHASAGGCSTGDPCTDP